MNTLPKMPNTYNELTKRLDIYRKFASNLKIRESLLAYSAQTYAVGPTIIWTEDTADLELFTPDLDNYLTFEEPHNNPRTKLYLKRVLLKNRMTKGSILIKEATPETPKKRNMSAPKIPVHFCGYMVDDKGTLTIFDPSWHSADPGIYSTTAFYDSLDAFNIPYVHAYSRRSHHWQSLLENDVFCQTWSFAWLLCNGEEIPLPNTQEEAAERLNEYIQGLSKLFLAMEDLLVPMFPTQKWEGYTPEFVFQGIQDCPYLANMIFETF